MEQLSHRFVKSINSIDINADLGEFCNEEQLANELRILKYISSCSVACGGHTGDLKSIKIILDWFYFCFMQYHFRRRASLFAGDIYTQIKLHLHSSICKYSGPTYG